MMVISATKLRNALRRIDPTLDIRVKNVRVNGALMGCAGFIMSRANGHLVYVSTDINHGTVTEAMYRAAEHWKDFTGGLNQYAPLHPDTLATAISKELTR